MKSLKVHLVEFSIFITRNTGENKVDLWLYKRFSEAEVCWVQMSCFWLNQNSQ